MKEIIIEFRKISESAKKGSVSDLEYLIDVFEYEIFNTPKIKTDKDRNKLKNAVYDIVKDYDKKDESFQKLIQLTKI